MGQIAFRLGRAWLKLGSHDWDACRQDITEALAIPRITDDKRVDFIGMTYMYAPLAAVPGCLAATETYCAEAAQRSLPGTAWRLGADELGTWPLLWRGLVDEALTRAQAADALRSQLGGYPFIGTDISAQLAVLHLARGEREAAAGATDAILRRLEHAAVGKRDFYLHAAGRSSALLGNLSAAHALYQRLTGFISNGPLAQFLAQHLSGMVALIENRLTDAAEALERAAELESKLPVAKACGSARLLQSMLLFVQGNHVAAQDLAIQVLSEWEQEGMPGCVLLDGPAVLPLLEFAAENGIGVAARALRLFREDVRVPGLDSGGPTSGAALGHGPAQGATISAASLPEPLTPREIEVLRLIVAGMTNRQIGKELYIGEETVKSHVVHILRKLDVTSRTQAAVRGRELGF